MKILKIFFLILILTPSISAAEAGKITTVPSKNTATPTTTATSTATPTPTPTKIASEPKDRVAKIIEAVIKIVEEYPGDEKKIPRRQKIRDLINPVFDFDEMARRSLGANWDECTTAQKKEFVTVFSDLLAKTYLSKIELVRRDMVKVVDQTINQPTATVRTKIKYKGDEFPLDYRFQNSNGEWRVYDVKIESIGIVETKRHEFEAIIRKEKVSGLIDRLKRQRDEQASKNSN